MTGPFLSVIGVIKEDVIRRFLTAIPERFESASQDARLNGVLIDVDSSNRQSPQHRANPPTVGGDGKWGRSTFPSPYCYTEKLCLKRLSEKLQRVFKNLRGEGQLTEAAH